MVQSLPADAAVALEMSTLFSLVTLRHSGFDGPTPLPSAPLDEANVAPDSNLALVAEWQEFFMKHVDFDAHSKGVARYPQLIAGGVEQLAALRECQARGLPLWLLDRSTAVETVKIEACHQRELAKSWFGERPARETKNGLIEPRFGVPSMSECRQMMGQGHVPAFLNEIIVSERDRYMAHALLSNLHRVATVGKAPPVVLTFVGAAHVAGLEAAFNKAVDLPVEAHQEEISKLSALPAAAPEQAAGAEGSDEDEYYYEDEDEEGGPTPRTLDEAWVHCAAPREAGYWKARVAELLKRMANAGTLPHAPHENKKE